MKLFYCLFSLPKLNVFLWLAVLKILLDTGYNFIPSFLQFIVNCLLQHSDMVTILSNEFALFQ